MAAFTALPQLHPNAWSEACGEATALLQALLRIDTTNPPGNEIAAAEHLERSLAEDGLDSEIIESAPGRANLICRLPAAGQPTGGPLLLAGHLDVVPAGDLARWTHPPFSGTLADGMIWGRGAVDMKNMVAMSAMVLKLLARHGSTLRRDVILAAVADEEQGCSYGSRFLVESHADKVRAELALGEVGGFPQRAGKATIMPVQTAEKGVCWLRATARGPAGHGSIPRSDSAVLHLAAALQRLGATRLPQHNTPVVEQFIRKVASLQPLAERIVLPRLLTPQLSSLLLDRVFPDKEQARLFDALLRNTATPTVLEAGSATNVIPDAASAEIDGRLLPGRTADDLIRELRALIGHEIELEVIREAPGAVNHPHASPVWDAIERAVARHRPKLPVVPYMIPGFTDGQQFSRLGTRWYGFSPVWLDLDSGIRFSDLFHGYDERIPEDGFHWGLRLLFEVVHEVAC